MQGYRDRKVQGIFQKGFDWGIRVEVGRSTEMPALVHVTSSIHSAGFRVGGLLPQIQSEGLKPDCEALCGTQEPSRTACLS